MLEIPNIKSPNAKEISIVQQSFGICSFGLCNFIGTKPVEKITNYKIPNAKFRPWKSTALVWNLSVWTL